MWPWYLIGLLLVAGIVAREQIAAIVQHSKPAETSRKLEPRVAAQMKAAHARALPRPSPTPAPASKPVPPWPVQQEEEVTFFYCGIKKDNCVVDGGNFVYHGAPIKLADIYVPATKDAKCDRERLLGGDAKEALRVLLNDGKFELAAWKPIDEDQYGRKLRVVRRDGRSIGQVMVSKGLAQPWGADRKPWCP